MTGGRKRPPRWRYVLKAVVLRIASMIPVTNVLIGIREGFEEYARDRHFDEISGALRELEDLAGDRHLILEACSEEIEVLRTGGKAISAEVEAEIRKELEGLPEKAGFANYALEEGGLSIGILPKSKAARETPLRDAGEHYSEAVAYAMFPDPNERTNLRIGTAVPGRPEWKLVRPLGIGGFGEVWLARHSRIRRRRYAIKFADTQEKARRLEQDIDAVQDLDHPSIVPVVDAALGSEIPWIAMDYMPGGTLGRWFAREERTTEEVLSRLREVLSALAHAHGKGVWHRDVKPANVLIDRAGRARISDFGVAKVVMEAGEVPGGLSVFGPRTRFAGTLQWSPMEVIHGQAPPDARADVYAFGLMVWKMVVMRDLRAVPNFFLSLPDSPLGEFLKRCLGGYEARFEDCIQAQEEFKTLGSEEPPIVLSAGNLRHDEDGKPGEEATVALEGLDSPVAFCWCPPGEFSMGSPDGEHGREDNEGPVHRVVFREGLWIGKYAVTQELWEAVMGENPSCFHGEVNLPVENVSWDDCRRFLERLNERTREGQFRLPSEAEWEYACRAGTSTPFHFGETISTELANYDGRHVYGKGKKGEYREKTVAVDRFPPNPWGLYQVHGNVWEWCEDDWHDTYDEAPEDGSAWVDSSRGDRRVLRGGSWDDYPWFCRSAFRDVDSPDYRYWDDGARLVWVRGRRSP